MRKTACTSADNPIDYEKLPSGWEDLDLEHQTQSYTAAEDRWYTIQLLLWAVVGSFLGSTCLMMLLPYGWVTAALAIAYAASCLEIKRKGLRGWEPLLFVGFSLAALGMPGLLLIGLAIAAHLADKIATHWLYLRTTPPCDETDGREIRARWKSRFLFGAWSGDVSSPYFWYPVTFAVVGLLPLMARFLRSDSLSGRSWLHGAFLLFVGAVWLGGMTFISCGNTSFDWKNASTACWEAFKSFCTFNRHTLTAPGLFVSPSGTQKKRAIQVFVGFLALAYSIVTITGWLGANESSVADALGWYVAPLSLWLTAFMSVSPLLFFALMLIAIVGSTLAGLAGARCSETLHDATNRRLRESTDETAQESVFVGSILQNLSPVIIPLSACSHGAYLGPTRSGKTTALAALVEEFIGRGEYSVVYIDLKGDDTFPYECMRVAAERTRIRKGIAFPLKHFTNQVGHSTHVFDLFGQDFWRTRLSVYQQVDILVGALGLIYGVDYAKAFYSSSNAETVYFLMKRYGATIGSFRELMHVMRESADEMKEEIHPELRRAGGHIYALFKRLGDLDAMNPRKTDARSYEALTHGLHLSSLFQQPQGWYLRLPCALSPSAAPEIARLVIYGLLTAAELVRPRTTRVLLVIDEFARVVSKNLEFLLQAAHGMNVSVILTAQSLTDLRSGEVDLMPPVWTNCRFLRFFGVAEPRLLEDLQYLSGETIDTLSTTTDGPHGKSMSQQEIVVPRVNINEWAAATNDPLQSVVFLRPGAGYAQFGGLPIIVRHERTMTFEEYKRRLNAPWPAVSRETIVQMPVSATEHGPATKKKPDDDDWLLGPKGRPPEPPPDGKPGGGGAAAKPDGSDELKDFWEEQEKRRRKKK